MMTEPANHSERQVIEAQGDDEVLRTFRVMQQLRPHLTPDSYVAAVRRMREGGYRVAYIEEGGDVRAVAGFRIVEMLHRGKSVYVDDLVTDEEWRSRGLGQTLLDWLLAFCRENECGQFHLDSGVQRARAHRFYFDAGMQISSFHFAMPVSPD